MAQEHLNTLITGTGLEAEDIAAIMALPAEGEQDLSAYATKVHKAVETQVKNDPKFWESLDENNVSPAFQKKIEAQQYGRAVNITRQKILKAAGLKEEDLGEMSDDDKKNLETFVGKTFEKYASTKVSDKELQKDLQEARKKYEDLELAIPEREGKLKTAYESQANSEKLDFIILAELATVENLKAPASYLVKEIAETLKGENSFSISGLKAVPMQKDKPNLKLLDGSKEVTLKDLIIKKLKSDGLIAEPAKAGPQKGTTKVDVVPDGTGGLQISGHVQSLINASKPA